MPLTPYQYRPTTPPCAEHLGLAPNSAHSRNTSGSSAWSVESSPNSVNTQVTTPGTRSPTREHGPPLLPKIRTQDQSIEASYTHSYQPHRRALSQAHNLPGKPVAQSRPTPYRSTTSPPECISLISPVSTASFCSELSSAVNSAVQSPVTITPSHRRPSLAHSRSVSASGIDDITLARYGYPTYRRTPTYVTRPYYSPSVIPGTSIFTPPATIVPERLQPYNLPEEQRCDDAHIPTMNLNSYLRGANPPVGIVRQVNTVLGRGMHNYFWWDIRNLRTWSDFTLDTIQAVPSFPEFLDVNINAASFPVPHIAPARLHPDSEAALVDIIRDFYAVKINAALKITINAYRHLAMRPAKERDGPHFVSNYVDDVEKTLMGNGKGRVVGLVKSYERWNTGMRAEAPHKKVIYLEGLAHLHRYMREHGCRYGFIMTETELVCVRAGTADTPYFGLLELAPAIETRTRDGLTACMALWYLHMLAKDQPLPGQCGWKLDVGGPAAMTRTHVLEQKDSWIPEPQIGEKRDAKRVRGWVMPGDPWNKKKEGGKVWCK